MFIDQHLVRLIAYLQVLPFSKTVQTLQPRKLLVVRDVVMNPSDQLCIMIDPDSVLEYSGKPVTLFHADRHSPTHQLFGVCQRWWRGRVHTWACVAWPTPTSSLWPPQGTKEIVRCGRQNWVQENVLVRAEREHWTLKLWRSGWSEATPHYLDVGRSPVGACMVIDYHCSLGFIFVWR